MFHIVVDGVCKASGRKREHYHERHDKKGGLSRFYILNGKSPKLSEKVIMDQILLN